MYYPLRLDIIKTVTGLLTNICPILINGKLKVNVLPLKQSLLPIGIVISLAFIANLEFNGCIILQANSCGCVAQK